jgi:hypothetical protein
MKSFKYIISILLFCCSINSIAQIEKGLLPQESSYSVIFEKSDLKLVNKTKLFIAPNGVLFALVDNIVVPIHLAEDGKESEPVDFILDLSKKYPNAQDIMWLDNQGIIIRYGKRIKNITDKGVSDIITMPNDKFSIYPAQENLIYIAVSEKNNSTSLFLFDISTQESCKLIDLPFKISYLDGDGDFCFVSSGNDIYYLSEQIVTKVFSAPEAVTSLATSEYGLFYGTSEGIYYMDNPDESICFFKANVKQLLCNHNMLYIFTKDGSMSIINNANGYHDMYQRIQDTNPNESDNSMFRTEKIIITKKSLRTK